MTKHLYSRQRFVSAVLLAFLVLLPVQPAGAGGPRYVAGASFFDPSVKGMPLTWAQTPINYYTDQGDLSPVLPHPTADAFVADAFTRWTSIQTAALAVNQAGQLSEDVNGSNVILNSDGTITVPADILPTATNKPIGIVYDADGTVTDALLGSGAGSAADCFTNAAYGGPDNFSSDGHLVHALVVINGNCAKTSSQLPDVEYRLVRVLGRVLGLDWSQLNLNVITGSPHPVSADYAGFPIMHQMDPISCVPISACYPNADQPKMDDVAAVFRLYPVTPQNQSLFPGKHPFADNTGRVHGSVYFVAASGQPVQPMQGVNVVARWIDPASHQPSRQYALASVSGFFFHGNAGNSVTGLVDPSGQPWNRFGSDDTTVEGFFDLAGLQFPDAQSPAQYQLTVEANDPNWSQLLWPYGPWQVTPSGMAPPIVVTITRGADVQQDILMAGSASQVKDAHEPESFVSPAATPTAGDWLGSLSGYGDEDYFWFAGQTNHTLSVEVTALDESGAPTQSKARPVVGMWGMASPPGTTPGAATPTAFNSGTFAVSRLNAILLQTTNFRIGIVDERGDGRPDYAYRTRVFYGDSVTPARASAGGGNVLTIKGMGFRAGTTVTVGQINTSALFVVANQVIFSAPALADGVQDIALADPNTGASSTLTGVLTYGAGPNDSIALLLGSNPPVPAGVEAPNPVRARVLAADGVTPVAGASVYFSVSPVAALSACGGASNCTVLSDGSGEISTRVTPPASGVYTITATLAPASYSSPKYVQATLSAQASALDIGVLSPYRWIAQGASLDAPLTARVLSNGSPLMGRTVNYFVTSGTVTLTTNSASTDANGYATTTVQIRNLAGDVQVSACVAPANAPCAALYIHRVAPSSVQLQAIAGNAQMVAVGQAFQPVIVRVTDSASPPNPVQAAAVTFSSLVHRPDSPGNGKNPKMPVILSSSQSLVTSDVAGVASLVPSSGGVSGPVEVEIMATAGTSAVQNFQVQSAWLGAGASNRHAGVRSGNTQKRSCPPRTRSCYSIY